MARGANAIVARGAKTIVESSVRTIVESGVKAIVECGVKAIAVFLLTLLPLIPLGAWANEAVPTEVDRVQQKRAVELSEHLRCLVCQNQTIADSNAELAQDLRRQVREQIAAGRSDSEIVAFMVQRYGDFVLYKPPVKATTLLLWFGPLALLLLGGFVLLRNLRSRAGRIEPAPLTDEESRRANTLLQGGGPALGSTLPEDSAAGGRG